MRSRIQATLAPKGDIIYFLFGGREKRASAGFEYLNKVVTVIPVIQRILYAMPRSKHFTHILTLNTYINSSHIY